MAAAKVPKGIPSRVSVEPLESTLTSRLAKHPGGSQCDKETSKDEILEILRTRADRLTDEEFEEVLNMLDVEADDEVMAAHYEEIEVKVTADSGAGDHVSNSADLGSPVIRPSKGSKAGKAFMAASGDRIENEGEVDILLEGGSVPIKSVFQIANVTRPLMSISRICDHDDNTVKFDKHKGVVFNKRGKELCRFLRDGALYTMKFKVRRPAGNTASPFGRQGASR